MPIKPMAVKNAENLNITVLDGKKVVLVHIVAVAFPAAVLHVLELLFVVTFEVVENALAVQDFFRIVKKDFVVPGFLGVGKVVDPGGNQDVFVFFVKLVTWHQNDCVVQRWRDLTNTLFTHWTLRLNSYRSSHILIICFYTVSINRILKPWRQI